MMATATAVTLARHLGSDSSLSKLNGNFQLKAKLSAKGAKRQQKVDRKQMSSMHEGMQVSDRHKACFQEYMMI